MQAIFETVFDVIYLCTVITLGIIMICKSKGRKQYLLYGIMAVTLGAGDSFHIVPRAVALCTTGLESFRNVDDTKNLRLRLDCTDRVQFHEECR